MIGCVLPKYSISNVRILIIHPDDRQRMWFHSFGVRQGVGIRFEIFFKPLKLNGLP